MNPTKLFLLIRLLLVQVGLQLTSLADEHPNVLVILTDDQGWGDLGFHGNQQLQTPHLDRLARESLRFTRFYVQPVCSPTRAEFLTGRWFPRGGVYGTSAGGERMNPDETTIADVFRAAGYFTANIGKWHNGQQWPCHPNARGFEYFHGFTSGHWGHYFDYVLEENNVTVPTTGFITDRFTDLALQFISDSVEVNERPFFLYLTHATPHSPMQVPDRYWNRHKELGLAQRGTDADREDPVHTRAALAMVENLDDNVGRILQHLDTLDIADNTIVVFFTDNGPNGHRWNGGMRGIKGSTDEGGVRSPLFLRWPAGLSGDREIDTLTAVVDLLPTLASLAGLEPDYPKPLDGRDLEPLLRGRETADADRLVFNFWNDRLSVRSQDFRLDHDGRLYDMCHDPGQTKNVADTFPDVANRLRAAAERYREDVVKGAIDRDRPFTVGHPGHPDTHLPARDASFAGNIERSNRHPNDTYLRNWTSPEDRIYWDVEIVEGGRFAVEVHYAAPPADVGATLELRLGEVSVSGRIKQPHDPPLLGAAEDRVPRIESYVKIFRPVALGEIELEAGRGQLVLSAPRIPGAQAAEFGSLVLRRL